MDAMSDAIDNAAVVCYGVSAACEQRPSVSVVILFCSALLLHTYSRSFASTDKDSANCRLEAQVHDIPAELIHLIELFELIHGITQYAHQTGTEMIPMM
eukprot:COSAG02_NODE_7703_length_2884_cov_6.940754_2_plen_99_part_00